MIKGVITSEQLKQEFNEVKQSIKLKCKDFDNSCVVFVYNSLDNNAIDEVHRSECVYADEIALISDALHSVRGLKVVLIDGEDQFIAQAPKLKNSYDNVYVYSMAQNLFGVGRRCFVPLVCEYYGFVNISSNSRSSFLGGDKKLMHQLLENEVSLPHRLFLPENDINLANDFRRTVDAVLLKPNSESASIGIEKITKDVDDEDAKQIISKSLEEYKSVFLEEFIQGDEVECAVLPWYDELYVSTPVKIVKQGDYLDYTTVAYDQYDFEIYTGKMSKMIMEQALRAYFVLGFDSIARFDFMVNGNKTYLFDITPNPTISKCSSANTALKQVSNDDRTIYQILLFQKLLVPTLH